ncbi:putative U box domain, armadillo-like helical, Zinc finger, RING/FYVE/PHD-type [Helianthus debilis subsp. tardiflorus]
MDVEIEVPSHFLCPISMQPMKDPVTISTGITYDRESIQRWFFTSKRTSCPVTKQPVSGTDLIPNHTLRRLIQSWSKINSHYGFDLIPATKKPVDKLEIVKLVNDAKRHPENQIKCLRRLRSIAQASDWSNTSCMEDLKLFEFLTTVILSEHNTGSVTEACDEALFVLHHLQCMDSVLSNALLRMSGPSRPEGTSADPASTVSSGFALLNALLHVMKFGNVQSRSHAITLLRSVIKVTDPAQISSVTPELFNQTVRILKENVLRQTIKAALELVVEIIRWGRNRIKAAESGMVLVLIDLLIESSDRRGCELMLVVLEQICRCAEGRAKLVEHAAGLATVSKKILRVSHVASDRAVRILCLVGRFCASNGVLQEMVEVGVVSKLCLMIQIDYSERTKERVKQILTLHSRVWKDASCVPAHLLSSYPSL